MQYTYQIGSISQRYHVGDKNKENCCIFLDANLFTAEIAEIRDRESEKKNHYYFQINDCPAATSG